MVAPAWLVAIPAAPLFRIHIPGAPGRLVRGVAEGTPDDGIGCIGVGADAAEVPGAGPMARCIPWLALEGVDKLVLVLWRVLAR